MKIITLGTEKNLFDPASLPARRIAEYGTVVEELHIIVFTASARGAPSLKLADNVWVYAACGGNKFMALWRAVMVAREIVRQRRLEPEQTIISSQDPFEIGLLSWLIARWLGFALHVQVHIDFFSPFFRQESWRQHFQSRLAPFILQRSDAIRVVSQKIRGFLTETIRIDAARVLVVPVFSDAIHLSQAESVALRDKYPQFEAVVLMLSRLVKQKNIPLAVKAFKSVVQKKPRVGLIIVGSGPEEQHIKDTVNSLGLANSVCFEPWTGKPWGYIKGADVFALTSNYEGWGMTAVEAALLGTPLVMTNVGCAGELLIDGELVSIVPPADQAAVEMALLKLLEVKRSGNHASEAVERVRHLLGTKEEYLRRLSASWQNALDLRKS